MRVLGEFEDGLRLRDLVRKQAFLFPPPMTPSEGHGLAERRSRSTASAPAATA